MARRIYDPAMVRDLLAERERNLWSLGELSRRSGIPVGTGLPSCQEWFARVLAERADR